MGNSTEPVASRPFPRPRRPFAPVSTPGWNSPVHLQTHVNYVGFAGITVGQAHLLDDVIDNLELDLALGSPSPSYYERRTLTYSLGAEHGLFSALSAGQ